jgi:hypothetical protein
MCGFTLDFMELKMYEFLLTVNISFIIVIHINS